VIVSPALRRVLIALGLGAIVLILCSRQLTHLLTEFWWYDAAGQPEVLQTVLLWQLAIWVAAFGVYTGFLGLNYLWADRNASTRVFRIAASADREWVFSRQQLPPRAVPTVITIVAALAATSSTPAWLRVAEFWHGETFGRVDPIFEKDLGFFVFQLPFYEGLLSWLLVLVLLTLLLVALFYGLCGEIDLRRGWQQFIYGGTKTHIGLLASLAIALVAISFWLARYDLLYSTAGVVYGAGFTDAHARLLALTLLAVVSFGLAITFAVTIKQPTFRAPIYGTAVYLGAYVLLLVAYPAVQQSTFVAPNELDKERPYIEHNLEATLQGYGLDGVERQPFAVENNLDRDAIAANQATIDNIRLWDEGPLLKTYQQIQEFRPFYSFRDVDIDRYTLGDDYRQVLLSARENAWSGQPAAQKWLNQHFIYTHGYGIAMSPANRNTPQGLPELFVKDIPPIAAHPALEIERPGLYYSEYGPEDASYVFTGGAGIDELDYSATTETIADGNATTDGGETRVETRYDGLGGVPIGNFGRRAAYAYIFNDVNMLLSSYFGPETRVHYYRDVRQRVQKLAPFLHFDSDPYLAIVDGNLKWIVDAYTLSNRYPYSEPIGRVLNRDYPQLTIGFTQNFNYVRNSVKAVVDAYDGTATLYAIDLEDPVLGAYRSLFPQLFTQEIPPELRAHFRYPLDLFRAQALMYLRYHMRDARSFYNQDDLWHFPNTIVETSQDPPQKVKVPIDPYYAIARLPDGDREEFTTILPFTPAGKLPMVAWLAARSDGGNYGKLLLYEFPKQERVFGPQQIEARIDQNTDISQQLTLWDQQGSEVVRGNILVIPIEDSLLYVEPIYLKAANQGGLPELKRVIVAYDTAVAMEETLEAALGKVLGYKPSEPTANTTDSAPILPAFEGDRAASVQQAQATFQDAKAAAARGDWATYGQRLNELETILNRLNQPTASRQPNGIPSNAP